MKIEALSTFTAFDGSMIVVNKGEVREISDKLAAYYIEHGIAKKARSNAKETEVAPPVDARNPVFDPTTAPADAEDEAPAA
ncbi:MAG: hypothetical protein IPG83_02425 [Novosphingobium sp.]|nr:hypothetical protein [Novosphingobium sp.]